MMPVVQYRAVAQSLLLDEVRQEPRCLPLEWMIGLVRATETNVIRNRQTQHLANGITHLLADLLAHLGGTSAAGALANPCLYERLKVRGELCQFVRAMRPRKFTEVHQDGNTVENTARRVALLRQPANVLFDRWSNPGTADAVDRDGTDVIALEHDNLP